MLPTAIPRLARPTVVLRPFEGRDAGMVASVAADPLIPLITTVPAHGSEDDVAAYLQRQHDRLRDGVGYSFAVATPDTDETVGQIGLWTREIDRGRACIGYWIAPRFRRRGYATSALTAVTEWPRRCRRSSACNCSWSRGTRVRGARLKPAGPSARGFSGAGSGSARSPRTGTSTAAWAATG